MRRQIGLWSCAWLAAAVLMAAGPACAQEAPGAPDAPVAPSEAHGAWVAKILRPTRARPTPGSEEAGWPVQTTLPGGYFPQELLVLAQRQDRLGRTWLRVRLPRRPNDAAGWIPADAVRLRHTGWWVSVSTRTRTVRAYHDGHLRLQVRAVVGASSTPTPHGLFAVLLAARQPDPRGFLGPWALHLTAHSNVLENYGGGPGRVAIHGRDGASLLDPLGSARSHGCIRIENAAITRLARLLRPGTPVRITR